MNTEKIKSIYHEKGIVKFKMYGLDYTIEKQENGIVTIYVDTYKNQKKLYNSIDEVLTNYYIYNESIESNDERIQNIS